MILCLRPADRGAAVPVIPVPDTLKEVAGEKILSTPDRRRFFLSQTPQGFRFAILKAALHEAARMGFRGTDEAQLVEKLYIYGQTKLGNDTIMNLVMRYKNKKSLHAILFELKDSYSQSGPYIPE